MKDRVGKKSKQTIYQCTTC